MTLHDKSGSADIALYTYAPRRAEPRADRGARALVKAFLRRILGAV